MPIDPESRISPKRYNLVGAQLHYAIKSNTDGWEYDGPDGVLEPIEKAVRVLPSRIQYLVEDLSILHENGYLDDDIREAIYEEYEIEYPSDTDGEPSDIVKGLMEIQRKDQLYSPPLAVYGVPRHTFNTMEIGVYLGHVLHTIDENSEADLHHPALISGFMMGLAGKWIDNKQGVDQIGLWMKQLNGPLTEEMNDIEALQAELLRSIDKSTEEIGLHGEIADRLDAVGLEPVLPLIIEVYEQIAPKVQEEYGSSTFISPNKIEALPLGDIVYPIAAELKANDQISKAQALADAALGDIQVLSEKTAKQEMCEIDVLAAHWLSNTNLISKSSLELLKNKFNKASGNIHGQHLNDMCGTGTSPEPWDDYPLLEKTSGDRKLTDYGRFLAHIIAGRKLTQVTYPLADGIDTEELQVFYPENEKLVYMPDEADVLTACYACALGHLDGDRNYKKLFEDAYEERINR